MAQIIAIDPGTHKCGLLIADIDKEIVIDAKVSPPNSVLDLINVWGNKYSIQLTLLGNGTNSSYWYSKLLTQNISPIRLVDERGTTFRARSRYWEIYPPNLLLRLLPKGMWLPPNNLDTISALVLLEDYLEKKILWPDQVGFKTWPE